MEVKIEMTPNKTSDIEYAKQVKDVAKDLIETCKKCGVVRLDYIHDYFKIQIYRHLQLNHKQHLDLVQGEE